METEENEKKNELKKIKTEKIEWNNLFKKGKK
jgi:hypothetical protein